MMGLIYMTEGVRLWVGGTLLYYCTISWFIVCLQITAYIADDGVVFTQKQRWSGSEWVEHYCITVPLVDSLSVYRLQPVLLMMRLCLHDKGGQALSGRNITVLLYH